MYLRVGVGFQNGHGNLNGISATKRRRIDKVSLAVQTSGTYVGILKISKHHGANPSPTHIDHSHRSIAIRASVGASLGSSECRGK
jgi:hypothetical protein